MNPQEKVIAMRSIYFNEKARESELKQQKNYVKNPANFLAEQFGKIDGFDARWSSLITNNPLLFEDVDYLRIKNYVDNQITQKEVEAYKRNELRELYATFDNMLMCNLKYYDRIINFCTMVFMHYVRIDGEVTTEHMKKMPYHLSMTPTQIWCAALSNTSSTKFELEYAWSIKGLEYPIKGSDKSIIELNWNKLYRVPSFAKFMEFSAARVGTQGFRNTLLNDITTNRKLSQVCSKFTRTTVALSEQQLDSIYEFISEEEDMKNKLFAALEKCMLVLFGGDNSQFSIYVYSNEFYIMTAKFSMKVSKHENGAITKDYLANSYECFMAEEFLIPSIKTQIEWARYKSPGHFNYDKMILQSLLVNMLETNYRGTVGFKRMNDFGIVSKVTFSGIFNNVKIQEDFMLDNRTLKTVTKVLSKKNAAKYLIDRGYHLFGNEADVLKLIEVTKPLIINHYLNYCIPVITHMSVSIQNNQAIKNDIIDVILAGDIAPERLNNSNIKYTSLMNINEKSLMSVALQKQQRRANVSKRSYWQVIE